MNRVKNTFFPVRFVASACGKVMVHKRDLVRDSFLCLFIFHLFVCLTVSRVQKYFTDYFKLPFGLSMNRELLYLSGKNDAMIKLSSIHYVHPFSARTYVSLSGELD